MTKLELAKLIDSQELHQFKQMDDYLEIVNQEPPRGLVKDHPTASGVKYIPIDKIELMLTKIFQEWYVEIKETKQLLNSLSVTVRLHYKVPVTGEWRFQDGVGAVPIQVDKGKNASDLSAIKSNAIMLGLPSAESYAVKDAAEKIGSVFGGNLNRKDTIAFTPSYSVHVFRTDEDYKTELATLKSAEAIRDWINEMPIEEKRLVEPLAFERLMELLGENN